MNDHESALVSQGLLEGIYHHLQEPKAVLTTSHLRPNQNPSLMPPGTLQKRRVYMIVQGQWGGGEFWKRSRNGHDRRLTLEVRAGRRLLEAPPPTGPWNARSARSARSARRSRAVAVYVQGRSREPTMCSRDTGRYT